MSFVIRTRRRPTSSAGSILLRDVFTITVSGEHDRMSVTILVAKEIRLHEVLGAGEREEATFLRLEDASGSVLRFRECLFHKCL